MLWKRYATLEADLMSALELGPDELCKELGERNCVRDIHVIALGGNDPFRSGINVPPRQPLSTTSILEAEIPRLRIEPATASLTVMTRFPRPIRIAPFSNSLCTVVTRATRNSLQAGQANTALVIM